MTQKQQQRPAIAPGGQLWVTSPSTLLKATSPANLARYLIQRRGMLAGSGIDVLADVATRKEAPAPDLQLLLMPILWLDQGLTKPYEHGFTVAAAALNPQSRGSITLRSSDPMAAPLIRPNYSSDPQDEDTRILVEGIKLARRIVSTEPFDRLRGDGSRRGGKPRPTRHSDRTSARTRRPTTTRWAPAEWEPTPWR